MTADDNTLSDAPNTGATTGSGYVDPHYRTAYTGGTLPENLPAAPWPLLESWWATAQETLQKMGGEPGAVCLSTVDADGSPDARFVLLKGLSPAGPRFFTDAGSTKVQHIRHNPAVALTFYWPQLHWQIRLRGQCQAVSSTAADEYFQNRPRGSQIAARASNQSQPLESRAELIQRTETLSASLAGSSVPTPPSWVGFDILAHTVEFWAGDSDRLHDRARYVTTHGVPASLSDVGLWAATRLQP